jgi:hypothetical protein
MTSARQEVPGSQKPSPAGPPPLAPLLMMAFWMLLGAASGIHATQSAWRLMGFAVGEVSIAVPVGGVAGALAGALLGLISNPRLLVLLMAVFAGSAAGAVAGKVPWGSVGEIGGQVAGGLVGGIAWAAWLFLGRGKDQGL